MANLSDAGVKIVATKVGKELVDYINLTNETDYAIVYATIPNTEVVDGNVEIDSSSSGRWAYSNNLEGYFSEGHVKDWLGVNSTYDWNGDLKKKNEYAEKSRQKYAAYTALVEAIKKTGGDVRIEYTDCDPAMDWMGSGIARLELVNGAVLYSHSFDEETLSIEKFAKMQGESEFWALEYLHGDEAGAAYAKYLEECIEQKKRLSSIDDWYDNEYEG